MNLKMMEQFEIMDTEMLASKVGGKTIYYGNGLYCYNSKGCWVNWPEAINKILTNSIVNGFSGGNAQVGIRGDLYNERFKVVFWRS